jgi:hypothetical protein
MSHIFDHTLVGDFYADYTNCSIDIELKKGKNLHQYIVSKIYCEIQRVLSSTSFIAEMGSLDNDLLKDCSPTINVALLADMCKDAFHHHLDSNLSISAFIPDPVNMCLLFRSRKILVPNDVVAIAPSEANVATSTLTPAGYDETNASFDINRFLTGFSNNNNVAGRMHEVKGSLTENKAIRMGVTFVNRGRGFLESVLVTNRHGDAKTLPYLNHL